MDNNERKAYEEEHDDNLRKLNQAEETLNDYQNQMQQKTRQLVDYVYSFYRDVPGGFSNTLSQSFEEVLDVYNYDLRLKQQEIDVFRDEEKRDFNLKMDW